MFKIGTIGTKGGWSSERLADTLGKINGFKLLIDMKELDLDLQTGSINYQGIDLRELDAIVIKKIGSKYSPDLMDRLEILRYLYKLGIPIFSSPINIMNVLNRLSCTLNLQKANIPIPPTVITEDIETAEQSVRKFQEAIFKPLYTSKARGMALIKHGPEARDQILEFKHDNPIMYIQKKVELCGYDLGLTFLGGKYLATYARCNNSDSWNTTTADGGEYTPYEPKAESIEIAHKAQEIFELDFTTVDLVETDNGPLIFEVSAFGGFRGLLETKGIDAAKLYAEYVLEQIK
mgnify:CR=1 FL=1